LLYDDSMTGTVLPPEEQALLNELTAVERGVLAEPKTSGRFLFDATGLMARKLWLWLALGGGYLLWRRLDGDPSGMVDVVAVVLLLAPFALLVHGHLWGPAAKLRAYELAMVEARYEEARALARAVAPAVQPMLADFLAAKPLAAMGRLDEALALHQRHGSEKPEEKLAYLGQVGVIYGQARRFEDQRRIAHELIDLAADKTVYLIDAAQIDLVCFRKVDEAEAMLAPCREKPLPTFAAYLWPMVDGIIAFERGDHHRAATLLAAAELQVRANLAAVVALTPVLSLINAYQILASAAAGRAGEARARFQAAESRLVRHDHSQLLARCRAAIA
jgi:hypothetical protein